MKQIKVLYIEDDSIEEITLNKFIKAECLNHLSGGNLEFYKDIKMRKEKFDSYDVIIGFDEEDGDKYKFIYFKN